jgi:uncharacterized protein with NRDE domain
MCLILVAWRCHPDYPLVVAANRDEFFARPTRRAGFWLDAPDVVAGRDEQEGGTWMGATRHGRFAALTNFRDPASQRDGAPSRGHLVRDFLAGSASAESYLERLAALAPAYNGFNLLVGDGQTLACFSNVSRQIQILSPGIHGVSNHLLNTPWPKVAAAKSALHDALGALPDDAPLFKLLRDDATYPDEELPRTGVSLEWERMLSSAFVRAPGYGTRSSTLLSLGRDGMVVFDEQTWLEGGRPGGRVRLRYSTISTDV